MSFQSFRTATQPYNCSVCDRYVQIEPQQHDLLVHTEKRLILACLACGYSDIVVDRFDHHIRTVHPDLQMKRSDFKTIVNPFYLIRQCTHHCCPFRTHDIETMHRHKLREHGVHINASGSQFVYEAFDMVPAMPKDLVQMFAADSARYIGRDDGGLKWTLSFPHTLPPANNYCLRYQGEPMGTIAVKVHNYCPTPEVKEVRSVPSARVRATILCTVTNPWSAVAIVETASRLQVGQFELVDSTVMEIPFVMKVADSFIDEDQF